MSDGTRRPRRSNVNAGTWNEDVLARGTGGRSKCRLSFGPQIRPTRGDPTAPRITIARGMNCCYVPAATAYSIPVAHSTRGSPCCSPTSTLPPTAPTSTPSRINVRRGATRCRSGSRARRRASSSRSAPDTASSTTPTRPTRPARAAPRRFRGSGFLSSLPSVIPAITRRPCRRPSRSRATTTARSGGRTSTASGS